ncbi:hypothetical protein Y1Q_0002984 [Alligator mississippiensis]|uniref:Uncharacterized protein n=1 Tax=Alligator mississippiensis TaxID=8496 RepID=A0A151MDC4_ALLMI|nr:hypothetical protein Y1Q_0002984 [Alligator mississippiensis]
MVGGSAPALPFSSVPRLVIPDGQLASNVIMLQSVSKLGFSSFVTVMDIMVGRRKIKILVINLRSSPEGTSPVSHMRKLRHRALE